MRLIATITGHRAGGVGGGGGGGVTAVLTTIVLTGPTTAVVSHAAATSYTATGYDQTGAVFPFTPTFNSSVSSIATIGSNGSAQGIAAGSTSITAVGINSLGTTITSNAITLAVTAQVVTTVQLSGGTTSVIATHTTTAFTAQAFDQLATAMSGQTYAFASSNTGAVTMNSGTGVATGVSAGNTSISATSAGVTSNLITLQVVAQAANSVSVSPSSFSVAVGSTQTLTATVMDQGTPANVITGASASWTSGTPSIASVGSGTGVVTGVAAGGAIITATFGGKSGTSAATVTAGATSSISAAPSSITGGPGSIRQLVITTNTGTDVTSQCTFTSNAPSTAYADYKPVLTSVTPSSLIQGATNQTVTVSGSGFTSAALGQAVVFSSLTGITVNSTTFTNSTTITLNLTIAGGATVGARTIQVTDSGHGNSGTVAFSISSASTPTNPVTSGLILNLKADAGTSTTTNGASVASWTDQSGTGTIYSQSTAGNQPTYVSVAQNGLPGMQFDGINDVLSAPGVVAALNIPNIVYFTVATRASGTGDTILFSNNDAANSAGVGLGSASGLTMYVGTGSTVASVTDAGTLGTAAHQVTWILNQAAANKQQIRKDGASVATATNAYSGTSTNAPTIGALNVPAGNNGPWTIHEILAYNPVTNPNILTTDQPTVEAYLQSKWGTP